jgi:hypothetical protein
LWKIFPSSIAILLVWTSFRHVFFVFFSSSFLFVQVIAKMSELLALGETEKLEALRGLSADKVLDSFETVRLFNDRFALHAALASLEVCAPSGCVATPCSREWRRDDNDEDKNEKKTLRLEEEMPLPWMCKPRTADGSAASHQLFLVYEAALLAQALRGGESEWQIQPFLPHGGVLIKVYVLGDLVSQQCRPSLPTRSRAARACCRWRASTTIAKSARRPSQWTPSCWTSWWPKCADDWRSHPLWNGRAARRKRPVLAGGRQLFPWVLRGVGCVCSCDRTGAGPAAAARSVAVVLAAGTADGASTAAAAAAAAAAAW